MVGNHDTRYLPSSLVRQVIDGLESDIVWRLNAGVYVPDVVVLLNADPLVIAERLRQRGVRSRFERQPGGSRAESDLYIAQSPIYAPPVGR